MIITKYNDIMKYLKSKIKGICFVDKIQIYKIKILPKFCDAWTSILRQGLNLIICISSISKSNSFFFFFAFSWFATKHSHKFCLNKTEENMEWTLMHISLFLKQKSTFKVILEKKMLQGIGRNLNIGSLQKKI